MLLPRTSLSEQVVSKVGEPLPADAAEKMAPDIEARFIELEAKILEQEHRPFWVFWNWWKLRREPRGKEFTEAAYKAIFSWVFAPTNVAMAGAGLTALASVILVFWQTTLLREQNNYFKEQNQAIQSQIIFQTSQDMRQRRTTIFTVLYEREETKDGPQARANSRTRTEALLEFVPLERQLQAGRKDGKVSLEGAFLDQVQVIGEDFSNVSFAITRLRNTSFRDVNFSSCDFRAATFEMTNFPECNLSNANFEGCLLNGARLGYADLKGANLSSADLEGVLFMSADLRGAQMYGIKNWDRIESIKYANIDGIENAPDGFRDWALSKGAIEDPSSTWNPRVGTAMSR